MASDGISDVDPVPLVALCAVPRLSQPALAALAPACEARIDPAHICLYEQRRRRPQLSTVRALAATLRVEASPLLKAASEDVVQLRVSAGPTACVLDTRIPRQCRALKSAPTALSSRRPAAPTAENTVTAVSPAA